MTGEEKQKLEVTKKLLLRPNFHKISKTLIDVRQILKKENLATLNKGKMKTISENHHLYAAGHPTLPPIGIRKKITK